MKQKKRRAELLRVATLCESIYGYITQYLLQSPNFSINYLKIVYALNFFEKFSPVLSL